MNLLQLKDELLISWEIYISDPQVLLRYILELKKEKKAKALQYLKVMF
jgi:hypothetical protein